MTRVLCWHLHGSWMTAFVHGPQTTLIPCTPDGGPFGLGRSGYPWPDRAVEIAPDELAGTDVDLVVLQRPQELDLAQRWLGRRLGRDVPAVYVEHDAPPGPVPDTRHPLADRSDITLAHVTHFNALMWDGGRAPQLVIEHGVPDPGLRYTGGLPRIAVTINEPVRRWRTTGTDLLPGFARLAPVDVYGIDSEALPGKLGLPADRLTGHGSLTPEPLHAELPRRRLYLHPFRWTSLGLSLIEAMMLGMPVVALATTEAVAAVPPGAGTVSNDLDRLHAAARELLHDPATARAAGLEARAGALERYHLDRFTADWAALITGLTR